jgi:Flp pilus assembly pilin Flp
MHQLARRGKAVVQWIVVAGIVVLALVAGVTLLGTRTNTKLNETATDVGNPKSLVSRFGSGS